jgi:hypothetical protein
VAGRREKGERRKEKGKGKRKAALPPRLTLCNRPL